MIDQNIKIQSHIDTIEISLSENNFADIDVLDLYDYATELPSKSKNRIVRVKLNLNRRKGHYSLIDNLSVFENEFMLAMQDLKIMKIDEVKLSRIDIAIDSSIIFDKDFKLLLFLFECITLKNENSSRWYTVDLEDLEEHTIKLHDKSLRSFEVEFYDKAKESKYRHKYATRLEFRFKRISVMSFHKYIHKLLNILKNIDNNILSVEQFMIHRLTKKWHNKKHEYLSLSDFVRTHKKFFYTSNIVKQVHKNSELKGKTENWFREFCRINSSIMKFYSKSDVKKLQAQLIKALKLYLKKND